MESLGTIAAARKYSTHPNTILRLIALGKLDARKDANGKWRILRSALENWQHERVGKRSRESGPVKPKTNRKPTSSDGNAKRRAVSPARAILTASFGRRRTKGLTT
jgi:hypothetical protein